MAYMCNRRRRPHYSKVAMEHRIFEKEDDASKLLELSSDAEARLLRMKHPHALKYCTTKLRVSKEKDECDKEKLRVANLKFSLTRKEAENGSLREVLQKALSDLKRNRKENKRLKETENQLESDNQSLKSQLDKRLTDLKDLRDMILYMFVSQEQGMYDLAREVEQCENENTFTDVKGQLEQVKIKLKETNATLEEVKIESFKIQRSEQDIKSKLRIDDNRIKEVGENSDKIISSQQQKIQQLESDLYHRYLKIKNLEETLYDTQNKMKNETKSCKALMGSEVSVLEIRNQLKQTITKLSETMVEVEKTKIEKDLFLADMETLKTQSQHDAVRMHDFEETITSKNKMIQQLEERVTHLNLDVRTLHEDLNRKAKTIDDRNDLNEILKEKERELAVVKDQLQKSLNNQKETEAQVNEFKRKTYLKQQSRQELEGKVREGEKQLIDLKKSSDETISSQKFRLHNLERECKSMRLKIESLEETLEKTKNQLQQTLTSLEETQTKQGELESERDLLKLTIQKLEKKQKEHLFKLSNLQKSNDAQVVTQNTIQTLQRELRGREQQVKHPQKQTDNTKKEINDDKDVLRETVKKKDNLICDQKELQKVAASLKDMERESDKVKAERDREQLATKDLQLKVSNTEYRMKELKQSSDEIISSQKQKIQHYKSVAKQLDLKVKELEELLDRTNKDAIAIDKLYKDLQEQDDQLLETKAKLSEANQELERKTKYYETIIQRLEEDNTEIITTHKQERQLLKSEIERSDFKLKRQEEMMHGLRKDINVKNHRVKGMEEQLSELKDSITKTTEKLKETESKLKEIEIMRDTDSTVVDELKKKLTEYEAQIKALEMMDKHTLPSESRRIEHLETEVEHRDAKLSELGEEMQHALAKLKETEAELDETKTRLSKAMGDKLTDNNPNIADLSDKNRPIKLAERFAELYDNQWTDGFDILQKYFSSEQNTIEALLDILQESMSFCIRHVHEQMENLQNVLGFSSTPEEEKVPANVRKLFKDCRKAMASTAARNLHNMYVSHVKRSKSQRLRASLEVKSYVEECVEICWLMVIQDPPVVFAPVAERGSELNTDMYKPYTSSGTHIDYTVWPALLLHEGGPILAKGVAQGHGKKSKRKE